MSSSQTDLGDSNRQFIIAEVKKETEAAISASQNKILAGIQKAVSESVETKYKVVFAETTGQKKGDTHTWQIVMAVLPILLTIGLGWWVSKAQTEITKQIDDQKQQLTTRLALTQEYQKRKLDKYESCTKSLNELSSALEGLRIDANDQKPASDAVRDLYDCAQNNPLYVTKNVADGLLNVQEYAIRVMQNARSGQIDMVEFESAVSTVEKRMLNELTGVTVQLEPSL